MAEIVTKGGKAVAVKADIGKESDITNLFEETKKHFGRVDILVNNAGVGTPAMEASVVDHGWSLEEVIALLN